MNILRLLCLFFRPAGLDFAQAGGGVFAGATEAMNAKNLQDWTGWVPGASREMDEKWIAAMNAIQRATDRNTGLVDPVILNSFSNMLGIDLSGLITAGDVQGREYGALAGQATGAGGAMIDAGARTLAAGQDVYNLARDPRGELHDYLKGQTIDTARAADSARGIAMGGVSAGNESDAVRRFEMDWQNQQLGRALQGEQGLAMSGYYGGQDLGGGLGFGAQGAQFTGAAANAPIAGRAAAYSMPMDWASMFTGAQQYNVLGPTQNWMQGQVMPYLNQGAASSRDRSYYGLQQDALENQMSVEGIGMFNTGYSTGRGFNAGSESGMGKPENWMSMGGGGGGMQGVGAGPG